MVERDTGRILDVDCNTILSVTKNFVASMFVGKNLRTDTEVLEREIKERYFALTQKPLIACMTIIGRYLDLFYDFRNTVDELLKESL